MQALEREARSAAYQKVPEGDARMKELNAVIGKYRMRARNQLKREFPELAPKSAWRYNLAPLRGNTRGRRAQPLAYEDQDLS